MKVLHLPFTYYPDPVGGTEVYVSALVASLTKHGIESVVAAPSADAASSRYEHDGTLVFRYPNEPNGGIEAAYGRPDPVAAQAIAEVIDESEPQVVHMHGLTSALSVEALRAARRRGIATVFTYHTPAVSCIRGTLLRYGTELCDGALIGSRCAACMLDRSGVPPLARDILARTPERLHSFARRVLPVRHIDTALRMRALTEMRHDLVRDTLGQADAVVAVCQWVRDVLLRIGAEPRRIVLSRQGTTLTTTQPRVARKATLPLKLAFVGRFDATKGLHIVLDAIARMPGVPVALDVYGVVQGEAAERYLEEARERVKGDARVRFRRPLDQRDVIPTLSRYDATLVPSQWLETGPLVVLESFGAGTPVIGSQLGGIEELVRSGWDGILVKHDDVSAWVDLLSRLVRSPSVLDELRANVAPPRTMDHVAIDMAALYESLAELPMATTGKGTQ
jgi:glycosyltransferase involved in cell wall biosynthesis